MSLTGEQESASNGATEPGPSTGVDRDPSPPVPEDPAILASNTSKAPTSNGHPPAVALPEHDEVLSATTSVSGWYDVDGHENSQEFANILEPDSGMNLLEVDDDYDDDNFSATYPISHYPRVKPAFQVEYPYGSGSGENGPDSGTINSSRTLYADDVEYTSEHGRWYCGDYYMPIDEDETSRQYVVHNVYLQFFDGELTTVPLEDPKYILDIGTGIGEWAIGMAEKHPQAEVFGIDIAPIQETRVPSNVEFQIESAEDEWIRPANKVDLVHIRNLSGAFRDWNFIYAQAFKCIKPGGYIEIVDFDEHQAYQNFLSFYPLGSHSHVMSQALAEASRMSGRPRGTAHLNPQLLINAGFVDIQESAHSLIIGDEGNTCYGSLWLAAVVTGIEPTCLRLLTKYKGWSADYVRELCNTVANETKAMARDPTRAAGFCVKLRVLVARKPLHPGQWTAQTLNETGEINSVEYSGDDSTLGSRSIQTTATGDAP